MPLKLSVDLAGPAGYAEAGYQYRALASKHQVGKYRVDV